MKFAFDIRFDNLNYRLIVFNISIILELILNKYFSKYSKFNDFKTKIRNNHLLLIYTNKFISYFYIFIIIIVIMLNHYKSLFDKI